MHSYGKLLLNLYIQLPIFPLSISFAASLVPLAMDIFIDGLFQVSRGIELCQGNMITYVALHI